MKFAALTIFPELMDAFWGNGMMRRAVADGVIEPIAVNIRDHAQGRHRVTDDRPYGGGCGMVMKPEPLAAAIAEARQAAPAAPVLLMSPQGIRFDQSMADDLANADGLIFICGRYEGIDERITESQVDLELSLGDFVITGGEIAAMMIMDSVTRLLPGVLGNDDSAQQDSFSSSRLDTGHYTRPPEWNGQRVPDALLSGHHAHIARWRRADALMRTLVRRPDLLHKKAPDKDEITLLEQWQREIETLIGNRGRGGAGSPSGR